MVYLSVPRVKVVALLHFRNARAILSSKGGQQCPDIRTRIPVFQSSIPETLSRWYGTVDATEEFRIAATTEDLY